MNRRCLIFAAPFEVEVVEEPFIRPAAGKVLVETICSAISPGTEMLVYRGMWPENVPIDESVEALSGEFAYPLKYGYSCVGKVIELGEGVSPEWLNQLAFAFQPHQSHFTASVSDLIKVPASVSVEQAAFLPNIETAVSFILDGKPLIGSNVLVVGQGVVGLLTTSLLAQFPLHSLITADTIPFRRDKSVEMGASVALDPDDINIKSELHKIFAQNGKADLTYELSGNPAALDFAVQSTGYTGRVIIGSWYGEKKAPIDLGGYFHRSKMTICSSQVSRITPDLSGLWTKERRMSLALMMSSRIKPERLITHRIPIEQAENAYQLIDRHNDSTIQVILTY